MVPLLLGRAVPALVATEQTQRMNRHQCSEKSGEAVNLHFGTTLFQIREMVGGGVEREFIYRCELLSCVQLFATPWTVAHQAPLSMEVSRQKHWSRQPFPSPGDLPDPGIEPWFPALQADSLPSEPPGKHEFVYTTQENRPRSSFHVFSSV